MPGWHDLTKQYQERGDLRTVGIIQEQHPDRCRLFMQWKQMDWPILVDSLNLFEVTAVPITLLIDEAGVIQKIRPKPEDLDAFLRRPSAGSGESGDQHHQNERSAIAPDLEALLRAIEADPKPTPRQYRDYGDALFLWGGPERLDDCIQAYQQAIASNPDDDDGIVHFRLGVALRTRYDAAAAPAADKTQAKAHRPEDFAGAIRHWAQALAIDPNQYIWRRRIQQYGPRLDKPYSFYDWVHEARRTIQARGESPHLLNVEPGGAEFAYPERDSEAGVGNRGSIDRQELPEIPSADPEGRILRDDEGFVQLETTLVPATGRDQQAYRVHLVFRPNASKKAHWNNEAEDLIVWLEPEAGWQIEDDAKPLTVLNPPQLVDQSPRRLEFEIRRAPDAPITDEANPPTLAAKGYALYYVCEDVDGTCLYRRQDFTIDLIGRP